MPKPFHPLKLDEFVDLLYSIELSRSIESVHMHHTWRPTRAQYKGVSTIEGMWAYHTQTNGWSDIAQHITIAPDGTIWTGRNWNQPPVSAKGFNGTNEAGPFMFEMIGDFDKGKDRFDGVQRETVLKVIAHVQKRFGLPPTSLRFHNSMAKKSCPGNAIDYDTILNDLEQVRRAIDGQPQQPSARARSAGFPFAEGASRLDQALSALRAPVSAIQDEGEACLHDHAQDIAFSRELANLPESSRAAARGELAPEVLNALRPHVVNLNQGRFSTNGQFRTRPGDVDAIFEEHLVKWAREHKDNKLPIVFYAHGGLTSEQSGLLTARNQVEWWLGNGAYPVHFVWETGLLEVLAQLVNPNRQRAIDLAGPGDFLIETLARTIGGIKIWGAMKASAERASDGDGGARYAAQKLAAFCTNPEFKDRIELHAIGHSAGAIFHSHFIPAALDEGAPGFRTLHLLAPAVRVDTFERQLLGLTGDGKGVDHLGVFTMARDFELDDTCLGLYRKSLLYLIYYGLEPERKTPILGLEESIRESATLKRLFDLDRKGSTAAEVVWSKTRHTSGRDASTSVTHGGFDNDPPTMESVARRILDRDDVKPFPVSAQRGLGTIEALQAREPALAAFLSPPALPFPGLSAAPPAGTRPGTPVGASRPARGRRRALCVGINAYPTAPLAGCVNDTRQWRQTFLELGFEEPLMLIDHEATRAAILERLRELVRTARSGDVVAFQFSGHGTQVPDVSADEAGGDSPDRDEAMCPIDFSQGRFIVDDDLASVFDEIAAGVNVTVFADCCHSGSNTRLAIGKPPAAGPGADVRKRFIAASPEIQQAHVAFRRALAGTRAAHRQGGYENAREVLFAACRSHEVALESNGNGHFTVRAIELLSRGFEGLTNEAFEKHVVHAFGANPGQNPELHCASALRAQPLFGPSGTAPGTPAADASRPFSGEPAWRGELARALEHAAQALRG